jgi:hypothetical protein
MGRPRRGYADRRVKTRELRQRFLIVCEGEKTELFDEIRGGRP